MKNSTKNVLRTVASILLGIVVYIVEFFLVYGIIKLVVKIIDVIRTRRYDKTHKTVENDDPTDEVDLDVNDWDHYSGTTWDCLKPFANTSIEKLDTSIYTYTEVTMRTVIENVIERYDASNALVVIVYNGRKLNVWVPRDLNTVRLDADQRVEFEVDEAFLNMKVKAADGNVHVVVIED